MKPAALDLELQFSAFPGSAAHRAVLRRPAVKRWIAHALAAPAEIAVTPLKPLTLTGTRLCDVEPSPSSPSTLSPQHFTAPPMSAQV